MIGACSYQSQSSRAFHDEGQAVGGLHQDHHQDEEEEQEVGPLTTGLPACLPCSWQGF